MGLHKTSGCRGICGQVIPGGRYLCPINGKRFDAVGAAETVCFLPDQTRIHQGMQCVPHFGRRKIAVGGNITDGRCKCNVTDFPALNALDCREDLLTEVVARGIHFRQLNAKDGLSRRRCRKCRLLWNNSFSKRKRRS